MGSFSLFHCGILEPGKETFYFLKDFLVSHSKRQLTALNEAPGFNSYLFFLGWSKKSERLLDQIR
jgi:hypothetical protein